MAVEMQHIVDRLIPVLTDLRSIGRISRNDAIRIAEAVVGTGQ